MPLPPIPPPILGYAPPNNIREIALRQKMVMYAILGYVVGIAFFIAVAPTASSANYAGLSVAALMVVLAAMVTAVVFVFRLALVLYGTAGGIVLGIATMFPVLGLIILLTINSKATRILMENGIKVGLMGAKKNQIPLA